MSNLGLTSADLQFSGSNAAAIEAPSILLETDTSVWSSLLSNLGDAFSFKKQPPLELTSTPIAVADPMAVKRSPASSAVSFVLHAGIISLIAWLTLVAHNHVVVQPQVKVTPVDISPFIPITMPAAKAMGGGGGGGVHSVVQASKGHLPPIEKVQTAPPQLLVVDHPKLAAQQAVAMPQAVKLPDSNMPNIGVTQSTQVALASQGSGSGSGFGQGLGGGIGSGHGSGIGPGSGGGYGGGVMSVGGGVAAPQVLHSVDPEFTDEARRARYEGAVSIRLIVDTNGNPQNIEVVRHLGMGLDEKAIEAVRQYKFKPAIYQGHPVAVRMVVDVAFHLY
ncbi:energy transducer TonB [Acidobacterium sp. S8]|uniref:energy transducer TonB n=1 Tax=Acidobacterium sp. S8 TaxID=1641854 RepID=UPI00131DEB2F|nr:energy transducer TonB [Acidobacterium sp. S8]